MPKNQYPCGFQPQLPVNLPTLSPEENLQGSTGPLGQLGFAVRRQINIEQWTRGIVLLLLYLAIDEEDDRPLIIDQPEESLDPQSIFDELVTRFRSAKKRRQIIIVTHNANLVVNTDADRVIVATVGRHRLGELPQIQYESGGLENPEIRKRVCDILEGGERAFKARAKRLRLGINEVSVQQVAVTTLA